MNHRPPDEELVRILTHQYMEVLTEYLPKTKRTYGFEYEFLPDRILTIDDLADIDEFLGEAGGEYVHGDRMFDNGIRVTFEPGGQIEYYSPPILADEDQYLDNSLNFIDRLNGEILERFGIAYIGTGYIPGRDSAPLCLRSPRYLNLHKRLASSGTRGHEMMKGTAAIHLHAAICNVDEIVPVFHRLCEMAGEEPFRMSTVRRDIWNNTDPVRCGVPPCCFEPLSSASELIDRLIRYALNAVVLGDTVTFHDSGDQSLESLLNHMTTIFTDIRFNLKGPTLELRTPDSIPVSRFKPMWRTFVNRIEAISF